MRLLKEKPGVNEADIERMLAAGDSGDDAQLPGGGRSDGAAGSGILGGGGRFGGGAAVIGVCLHVFSEVPVFLVM